jgi:hypothetical protein
MARKKRARVTRPALATRHDTPVARAPLLLILTGTTIGAFAVSLSAQNSIIHSGVVRSATDRHPVSSSSLLGHKP